jgi:hypothetical protein
LLPGRPSRGNPERRHHRANGAKATSCLQRGTGAPGGGRRAGRTERGAGAGPGTSVTGAAARGDGTQRQLDGTSVTLGNPRQTRSASAGLRSHGGQAMLRRSREAEPPDPLTNREASVGTPSPAARTRDSSESNERANHAGSREDEPHECEWLKQVTGFGEEQTAKVARNGEGGTKRDWNPATRRGWKVSEEQQRRKPGL